MYRDRTLISHIFDLGVCIHVLGDLSLYGGVVQITLDGQRAELIDVYGAAICGQVLFSRTGLANGSHLINVKLTGESANVTSTGGPAGLFVFKNFMQVFFCPSTCWHLTTYTDGPH